MDGWTLTKHIAKISSEIGQLDLKKNKEKTNEIGDLIVVETLEGIVDAKEEKKSFYLCYKQNKGEGLIDLNQVKNIEKIHLKWCFYLESEGNLGEILQVAHSFPKQFQKYCGYELKNIRFLSLLLIDEEQVKIRVFQDGMTFEFVADEVSMEVARNEALTLSAEIEVEYEIDTLQKLKDYINEVEAIVSEGIAINADCTEIKEASYECKEGRLNARFKNTKALSKLSFLHIDLELKSEFAQYQCKQKERELEIILPLAL